MRYFTLDEFACSCCQVSKMNNQTMMMLDDGRHKAGIPFVLSSAYRCENHNKNVGGSPTSSHLSGYAVDIKYTSSQDLYKIIDSCMKSGFNRFLIYKTFVHVDNDPTKPQNIIKWMKS